MVLDVWFSLPRSAGLSLLVVNPGVAAGGGKSLTEIRLPHLYNYGSHFGDMVEAWDSTIESLMRQYTLEPYLPNLLGVGCTREHDM